MKLFVVDRAIVRGGLHSAIFLSNSGVWQYLLCTAAAPRSPSGDNPSPRAVRPQSVLQGATELPYAMGYGATVVMRPAPRVQQRCTSSHCATVREG